MQLAEEKSGNGPSRPRLLFLLPPLAFLGLLLLVCFGGENWVYSLPAVHQNAQTVSITTDPLRGMLVLPERISPRAQVEAGGWIQSSVPAIQPQKITLYLDGKLVGETSALLSLPVESNTDSAAIRGWRVEFSVGDAQPGEHVLTVRAVLTGHDPITVAKTSLAVTP